MTAHKPCSSGHRSSFGRLLPSCICATAMDPLPAGSRRDAACRRRAHQKQKALLSRLQVSADQGVRRAGDVADWLSSRIVRAAATELLRRYWCEWRHLLQRAVGRAARPAGPPCELPSPREQVPPPRPPPLVLPPRPPELERQELYRVSYEALIDKVVELQLALRAAHDAAAAHVELEGGNSSVAK